MPPKARSSTEGASRAPAPAQYQILSRPPTSDNPITQSPPDLSDFSVSRNAPTMLPPVPNPRPMPVTPPRPKSMQSLSPHGLHQSASPLLENKLRRSVTKTHSHTQATSSPLVPRNLSHTSGKKPKSQTPSTSNESPSQAYAGPLFHASPAASALPIPRWFSKTINGRKEPLEETVLDTAAKEVLTNQSNESPTLRKSRMDIKKFLDEYPPKLSEKGKGREGQDIPASVNEDSDISSSLNAITLANLVSSLDTDGHPQPLDQTSLSSKEVFSLETEDSIESSVPKQGGLLLRNISELARPSTAPSDISAQTVDEEKQRKARSLALKRLLQTPVPQRPVPASSNLQTTAGGNGLQALPPARNLPGAFTSKAYPAVKLPYIHFDSHLPRSCHNNTQKVLELTQQSHETPQLLAPLGTLDTFDRLEKFSQDLDSTSLTNHERAKLLNNYIQRDRSTDSCKSATSSLQSSSSTECSSLMDEGRSKRTKDYVRRGRSSNCRPTTSSLQSFPGADCTPIVHYDPKKWLDNHLRNDILKIGTLNSDGATGVAT